jgi:hypothetical protein
MKSASSKLALSLQRDALRFAEADQDGNMELTFDEFIQMQPQQVREQHGVETLRGWFEAADTDSSGSVSINEFLLWCVMSTRSHPSVLPCSRCQPTSLPSARAAAGR